MRFDRSSLPFVKSRRARSSWKGALAGLAGGLIGAYVKSLAEPPLQRLGERLFPPAPGDKEKPGADIQGHPERMPPAKLAEETAEETTGETLDDSEKLRVQPVIHFTFGAACGIAYGVLAERTDPVGRGLGLPSAAALWAATHGSALPALGLQARPDRLPASAHVWELGSHLVYGLTADLARRAARRALR